MGPSLFYQYFSDYGLLTKTGIDIPGEAATIMHALENIGEVELATMTFGQSFQITPIQLAVMASSVINGGRRVTPHFGVEIRSQEGTTLKTFSWKEKTAYFRKKYPARCGKFWKRYVAGRIRAQSISGRIPDRRENSNLADAAAKRP